MENNRENKVRFFAQYWGQRTNKNVGIKKPTFRMASKNITMKYPLLVSNTKV